MKAIVVGRHELSGDEGLEVVVQHNVNFPATSEECKPILKQLLDEAHEENAALIFQAIPGQVNVCLPKLLEQGFQKVGIIVNEPGPRPTGVKKHFDFVATNTIELSNKAVQLVNFVNPRATVTSEEGILFVVVDPPLRFEFSHIEWF